MSPYWSVGNITAERDAALAAYRLKCDAYQIVLAEIKRLRVALDRVRDQIEAVDFFDGEEK